MIKLSSDCAVCRENTDLFAGTSGSSSFGSLPDHVNERDAYLIRDLVYEIVRCVAGHRDTVCAQRFQRLGIRQHFLCGFLDTLRIFGENRSCSIRHGSMTEDDRIQMLLITGYRCFFNDHFVKKFGCHRSHAADDAENRGFPVQICFFHYIFSFKVAWNN